MTTTTSAPSTLPRRSATGRWIRAFGRRTEFHYDFGDDWRFSVKLERVEPAKAGIKAPSILESKGEAPDQYGWDDEDE